MTYDIQRLESALVNADKAGDAIAAKIFADKIREIRSESMGAPVEPTLGDKAKSYGASALSGAAALPVGAFQLGANIGDYINESLDEDPMELTDYAKARAGRAGIEVPEYSPRGFGDEVNQTIKNQKAIKDALMVKAGREGFDWTELAGMVASPASLMRTGIAKGATLPGKMAEGAKLGGVYGAGMPVIGDDYSKQKITQALLGSITGGTIPVAMASGGKVGEYVSEFIKPFSKKGIASDVEKFVREKFGKDEKLVNALLQSKKGQTSAQAVAQANRAAKAAGKPESFGGHVVATEKGLSKTPEGGDILKTVYEKQQAGREDLIKAIAGTDDALASAQGARSANAARAYGEAYKQKVAADPELAKLAQNPYFKKSLGTALDLAKAKGLNAKDNLTEILHMVKIGVDKQLSKTGDDALAGAEKSAAMQLKKELTSWMGKKTGGAYSKARDEFARDSIPINRMETGKVLQDALINPIEKEVPAAFARAAKDAPKTLKNATGFKGYDKLDEVLSKDQVSSVKNVEDALLNEAKRKAMASESSSVLPALSGEVEFSLPHILSRPIVVANTVLKAISMNKTPEYRKVLSGIVKDPEKLGRILSKPENSKTKEIAMDILNKLQQAAPMSAARAAGE